MKISAPSALLNRREKTIAWICALVVGITAHWQWVDEPLRGQAKKLQDLIEGGVRIQKRDLLRIEAAKALRPRYEQELQPLRQQTSDEEEMSTLLTQVEGLTNELNLKITEMKPQKVHQFPAHKIFSINLALDGTLVDIVHFLHKIKEDHYRLRVEEFLLESKLPAQPNLTCRIQLSRLLIKPDP